MYPEIVQSERGGEKLCAGGYVFHSRLNRNNKTYWKCAQRFCPSTAITIINNSGHVHIQKETPHSHDPVEEAGAEEEEEEDEEEEKQGAKEEDYEHESDGEGESYVVESEGEENNSDMSEIEENKEEMLWEEWVEEGSDDEMSDGDEISDEETSEEMSDEEVSDEEEAEFHRTYSVYLEHQKIHKDNIRFLREPNHIIRLAVLERADKQLICFLNEICLNLFRGYFDLSKYEKKLLDNFTTSIFYLANKHVGWLDKKKFLIENSQDPFLSVLLNDLATSNYLCT